MLAAPTLWEEIVLELAAATGLSDRIAERDTATIQMLVDARGEDRAGTEREKSE
jgi:hypothetical protein